VYALAFTRDKRILLVTDERTSPLCWLPGGGLETNEPVVSALARELREEANASIEAYARLGTQRADDSVDGTSYQAFYWCRVEVATDFSPAHEVTERHLVRPEEFLDRLFWGRSDPKAAMLLARALELDESYDRQPDAG
jgi:ADP-ribose pyrophosphatase YjhB (NUDIX family)